MNHLFTILKATTGITLVAPMTLSLSNDFQKLNLSGSNKSLSEVVKPSQSFLANNLLDKRVANKQEDLYGIDGNPNYFFTNQRNGVLPSGNFDNGQEGDVPDIRLGGGLLFDYKDFNNATISKINATLKNGIFGDSNFMSINHTKIDYTGNSKNNSIDQKTLDENNLKGDVYAYNRKGKVDSWTTYDTEGNRHDDTGQTTYHNFQKANASSETDSIVDQSDFNFTPNYISIPEKTKTHYMELKKESKTKDTFKKLFNEELYDWYWKTWSQKI